MSKTILTAVLIASLGNATRMSFPGFEDGESLSISSTGRAELLNVSNISQPSNVTRATQISLLNVSRTLQRVYARESFLSHQNEDDLELVGDGIIPPNGQSDSRAAELKTIMGTNGRRYTYLKKLSSGNQGVVWSAKVSYRRSSASPDIDLKAKPDVVIKISHQKEAAMKASEKVAFRNEVKYMETVKECGHVVRILDYFADVSGFYYVVMEHMAGGDLYDSVASAGGYNEAQTHKVFVALLDGLECMHSHHLAHLDIKLENVLLDETGAAKLGDLGFSLPTPSKKTISRGSPDYLAPEIFARSAFDGTMVDVFALGVVLFSMVVGYSPFADDQYGGPEEFSMVQNDLQEAGVSEGLREVISCMLAQDKKARCSISRIKGSPWFKR